ncbi:MAG: TVP38/TMEM64 family protein [Elusimicrobiota bacterium]|nr:MAG: TVP38/TMEM64 family protein [Elusimicrobiota bacterium]
MGLAEAVTFVCLYVLACVAFLPISPLTLGAGVLFGVWKGFALVWCGATLGSCASFLLGRYLLREWVEKRAERWPLFGAIRRAVTRQGWKVVFLTRLAPVFPFTFLNYGYGLTRISLGSSRSRRSWGWRPARSSSSTSARRRARRTRRERSRGRRDSGR